MVPTIAGAPPSGAAWRHEIKFDGYRVQIHVANGRPAIYSRNGHDFSERYAALTASLHALPVRTAIIDAELIACDQNGQPDFRDLMRARAKAQNLCCVAFDLLQLGSTDLRRSPLSERRVRLQGLLDATPSAGVQFSEAFDDGAALLAEAEKLGIEGIVSKRQASSYVSGRTRDWLKIKTPAWRIANAWRSDVFNR